jgi:hypothetical protein
MEKDFKEYNEDVSNALWRDSNNDEITALRKRVAELERFHELDTKQISYLFEERNLLTADRDALKQQRDELLAAAEAIEIDAEECLDFDECTAMLVPIDTYHKLMEAIASVKEKQNENEIHRTSG